MRTAAVSTVAAVLVLGGTQLATAAPRQTASTASRVTLHLASPTSRAAVNDTTELTFTGTNLGTVRVYWLTRQVATATVSADGSAATALLDTARFADGPLLLTAAAWSADSAAPRALAPVLLTVANARADHHLPGYRLVFHDEFSGTTLNRDNWCTRYMYDFGTETPEQQARIPANCLGRDPATGTTLGTLDTLGGDGTHPGQEAEVYRDVNSQGTQMHTVQNGYLALHATATRLDQPFLKYESAMIRSRREFQPTANHPLYLTARLQLPDVLGTWPAFWLAGGYGDGHVRPPWPPEIDILEAPFNNSGNGADVQWTAVQTYTPDPSEFPDGPPQGPVGVTYADPNFDGNAYRDPAGSIRERWLEIGLEWYPDHACWYNNGRKIACVTYKWVANEGAADTNPAAVLLNLAVGGPWAGADGVDNAKFPTEYDVDHVRIYRK
jgi:beta-glucanase (GH16 family)